MVLAGKNKQKHFPINKNHLLFNLPFPQGKHQHSEHTYTNEQLFFKNSQNHFYLIQYTNIFALYCSMKWLQSHDTLNQDSIMTYSLKTTMTAHIVPLYHCSSQRKSLWYFQLPIKEVPKHSTLFILVLPLMVTLFTLYRWETMAQQVK